MVNSPFFTKKDKELHMKDKELHINFFVECILRPQSIQLHLHEARNTS